VASHTFDGQRKSVRKAGRQTRREREQRRKKVDYATLVTKLGKYPSEDTGSMFSLHRYSETKYKKYSLFGR